MDQRNRILSALLETLTDRGYADTSVAEVVRKAGVSSRTFYEHFEDKQNAFLALLESCTTQALADAGRAFDGQAVWPARVEASLTALVDFLVANPKIAYLTMVEVPAAGPEVVTIFQRCLRQSAPFTTPRPGDAPKSVIERSAVANQIIGAVLRTVYECLIADELARLPALLPDMVEIALTPYLGPRRTQEFLMARQS